MIDLTPTERNELFTVYRAYVQREGKNAEQQFAYLWDYAHMNDADRAVEQLRWIRAVERDNQGRAADIDRQLNDAKGSLITERKQLDTSLETLADLRTRLTPKAP